MDCLFGGSPAASSDGVRAVHSQPQSEHLPPTHAQRSLAEPIRLHAHFREYLHALSPIAIRRHALKPPHRGIATNQHFSPVFPAAVFQPFFRQPANHSVIPCSTYLESVWMRTSHRFSKRSTLG